MKIVKIWLANAPHRKSCKMDIEGWNEPSAETHRQNSCLQRLERAALSPVLYAKPVYEGGQPHIVNRIRRWPNSSQKLQSSIIFRISVNAHDATQNAASGGEGKNKLYLWYEYTGFIVVRPKEVCRVLPSSHVDSHRKAADDSDSFLAVCCILLNGSLQPAKPSPKSKFRWKLVQPSWPKNSVNLARGGNY